MTYRTAGEGPVVLLIHGITGDSRQWNQIIPQLADRYTVLAPDLLGHGQSAKPRIGAREGRAIAPPVRAITWNKRTTATTRAATPETLGRIIGLLRGFVGVRSSHARSPMGALDQRARKE